MSIKEVVRKEELSNGIGQVHHLGDVKFHWNVKKQFCKPQSVEGKYYFDVGKSRK